MKSTNISKNRRQTTIPRFIKLYQIYFSKSGQGSSAFFTSPTIFIHTLEHPLRQFHPSSPHSQHNLLSHLRPASQTAPSFSPHPRSFFTLKTITSFSFATSIQTHNMTTISASFVGYQGQARMLHRLSANHL